MKEDIPVHIIYIGGSKKMSRKRYGFMSFLFDIIMVVITGGLWLIWIFVREMRSR